MQGEELKVHNNGLIVSTNKNFIDLGESFVYTIRYKNKLDFDLYNVKISQIIPNEIKIKDISINTSEIQTIDDSNTRIDVYVNNIKPNEVKEIDIIVQLIDSKRLNAVTSCIYIEGKYLTDECEEIYLSESKEYINKIVNASLDITNMNLSQQAIVGEQITIGVMVGNTGHIRLDNIIVRDILSPELVFLNESVKINSKNDINASIISGINIGSLNPGEYKEINFDVIVKDKPLDKIIKNTTIANYKYFFGDDKNKRERIAHSKEYEIEIDIVNLNVIKKCDKTEISLQEEAIINFEIINDGTLCAKNIVLIEEIKKCFSIIEGSFSINGRIINNVDLSNGIIIGDLDVNQYYYISYKIKFNNGNCHATECIKTNLNFYYNQKSGCLFGEKKIEEKIYLKTNFSSFKYISISDKIYKLDKNPNIDEVNNIFVDVEEIEYHTIKTIIGTSNEGQISTGSKLIIKGVIKQTIEYITDDSNNTVYSLNSKTTFSTFIVLPGNFKNGYNVNLDYLIQDKNIKKRNKESVYTNIGILLIAKVREYL